MSARIYCEKCGSMVETKDEALQDLHSAWDETIKEKLELSVENKKLREEVSLWQSKADRLGYIASQLGMLNRDSEKFKKLWSELSTILHPSYKKVSE